MYRSYCPSDFLPKCLSRKIHARWCVRVVHDSFWFRLNLRWGGTLILKSRREFAIYYIVVALPLSSLKKHIL